MATVFFAAGIFRISITSELRDIFRSDTPQYAVLEDMTKVFAGSERDVFVLVESDKLFSPAGLEKLRTLHIDLQLIEDVENVLSIFSARAPPDAAGSRAKLVPAEITPATDLGALKQRLLGHPLVSGKLLSRDATLSVLAVSLAERERPFTATRKIIADLRASADQAFAGSGATIRLTGIPAVRVAVVGVLTRDQLVFKLAAYSITLALSWLFFASWSFLVLAIAPPVIATIWLLGGMGWAGQNISVVTNVVPNLVMVITFANAVHLLMGIRRARRKRAGATAAITDAVSSVGPATVLTSLTTAIALLSLTLVSQPVITRFALTAAYGTALAFIIVLSVVPALSTLLLRDARVSVAESGFSRLVAITSEMCARLVMARPGSIVAAGVAIFAVSSVLYALNTPHFRYRANLPQTSDAFDAMQIIDNRLAGTSTLRVFVRWPAGHRMVSQQTLEVIEKADAILRAEPLIREVWSLAGVARWLESGSWTRADVLNYLRDRPDGIARRLLAVDAGAALITGQLPDTDSPELLAAVRRLERAYAVLATSYPGVRFDVTGIAAQSARSATAMIWQLSRSLLVAIAIIIVLIGMALRSPVAALLSVLPNLLPIAAAGSYLYLSGQQLQFTSIIVFTIGFGIAVDSTIHVLNHYLRHRSGVDGRGAGLGHAGGDLSTAATDAPGALHRTITAIGPALIISTLALMAGGVTMLSPLPMAQLYGRLAVLVLAVALIGDILLLPALILVTRRWRRVPVREPA